CARRQQAGAVLIRHGLHCCVREERLAQLLDRHGWAVLAEEQPEGGVVVSGAHAAIRSAPCAVLRLWFEGGASSHTPASTRRAMRCSCWRTFACHQVFAVGRWPSTSR